MKEYLTTYGENQDFEYSQPAADGPVTVLFTDVEYGDEIYAYQATPTTPGNYTLTLPGEKNVCDRTLGVKVFYINSQSQPKADIFQVTLRRPYVTADELAAELGLTISATPANATEITRVKLEQLERYAFSRINALILTNLNCTFVRRPFRGSGTQSIALDENIVDVTRATVDDDLVFDKSEETAPWGITFVPGDGGNLILVKQADGDNTIINDPDFTPVFRDDREFIVSYISGYPVVPTPIRHAAVLLANDFLCNDYGQRNHYVVKADNQFGKIEYSPRAYVGTGNVSVDQLITPYVRVSMQVV
jgi:hypothetical protein